VIGITSEILSLGLDENHKDALGSFGQRDIDGQVSYTDLELSD